MKFTSVTFTCRRSGCGKAGRKVYWFLIRLPKNFTEENTRDTMFDLLVRFPLSVNDVKPRRETWNFLMKFAFRLRFTRVFVSLARAVPHEPFASLLIFRVPPALLHIPTRTKTTFDDIQAYSVLDFPWAKPPLNSQRRTRESEISNASAILEVSGQLSFLFYYWTWIGPFDSSGLFFFLISVFPYIL